MAEQLTVKELQSIIFNLGLRHRMHIWHDEKESAAITQTRIEEYTEQLKELQNGMV